MFSARSTAPQTDEYYLDLSRKLEALSGRVELVEGSVRHLPTRDDLLELVKSIHGVDRRLAKIEGFVIGKESMND